MIVTGAFTGAVFTAQAYFQFASLNMETAVGPVVTLSMFRELGPVLTGLMVAGRVGAAMSAEIGTMKVTQQIDALRALAVHPSGLSGGSARAGDADFDAVAGGRMRGLRRPRLLLCGGLRPQHRGGLFP